MVTRDEVTPSVLHGESGEGDEVVRHREKARFAADDDEDGRWINRTGCLNRRRCPIGNGSLPKGAWLRKLAAAKVRIETCATDAMKEEKRRMLE
jgi:hypothetical protein